MNSIWKKLIRICKIIPKNWDPSTFSLPTKFNDVAPITNRCLINLFNLNNFYVLEHFLKYILVINLLDYHERLSYFTWYFEGSINRIWFFWISKFLFQLHQKPYFLSCLQENGFILRNQLSERNYSKKTYLGRYEDIIAPTSDSFFSKLSDKFNLFTSKYVSCGV